MLSDELEMAVYHLERGQLLLLQQQERIARLRANGYVPDSAFQFLRQLEHTVIAFEHHFQILRKEAADKERPSDALPWLLAVIAAENVSP